VHMQHSHYLALQHMQSIMSAHAINDMHMQSIIYGDHLAWPLVVGALQSIICACSQVPWWEMVPYVPCNQNTHPCELHITSNM
jgi:hypothetical protein